LQSKFAADAFIINTVRFHPDELFLGAEYSFRVIGIVAVCTVGFILTKRIPGFLSRCRITLRLAFEEELCCMRFLRSTLYFSAMNSRLRFLLFVLHGEDISGMSVRDHGKKVADSRNVTKIFSVCAAFRG
jgi:hypothetical protein